MTESEYDFEELAARISDGAPVDWEEIESDLPTAEVRRIVSALKHVEAIAATHRKLDAPEETAEKELEGTATAFQGQPDVTQDDALHKAAAAGSWGPLELRQKLGEGAFGEVFRAWEGNLEREVALKLLRATDAGGSAAASSAVKEGKLLAKLRHPNVITVYGAEIHDGRVGIWMELVRGQTLEQLIRDHGKLGAQEATLVGIDACRALSAVHRAGLIHRDVKADNVMREEGGRLLLMDFSAGIESKTRTSSRDRGITGTPFYIAPEIWFEQEATQQSDIYSLGVLLYHLVTATYPVKGSSLRELRDKHEQGAVRLLRDERPDLPDAFVRVVERALARDPENRFATAGQMEHALSAALGVEGATETPSVTRDGRSHRRNWLLAAASILLVAVVGIGLVDRFDSGSTPIDKDSSSVSDNAVQQDRHDVVSPRITTYTVEAALTRLDASGVSEPLHSGAQLALGDELSLEFEASTSVYVYVIDEDDQGNAYVLFPIPGLELQNPLAPGVKHMLPGYREGKRLSWVVHTPGGREHLLVLASPERLSDFELAMSEVAYARTDQLAVPMPETARTGLRGIGIVQEASGVNDPGAAGQLFEMASLLASGSEVASGPWLRRIDLENPAP